MSYRHKNILFQGLLFTGLGIFAWLLLANYTESEPTILRTLRSPWAGLFMTVLFNALGFLTIRISAWLNTRYELDMHRKWKIVLAYVAVMAVFLLIDYSFLVSVKLLSGASQPFLFPNGGIRILIVVWFVEMVVLGLLIANRAMAQMYRYRQQIVRMREETIAARYAALQSQLNPHFLFNSFNTLVAEIKDDPKRAELFTRNLSNVYRYVLQAQKQPLATLREELTFASAYLYLHSVRLGNCIRYCMDIPAEDQDLRLPPLTLQLLIENILKHNAISTSHHMEITMSVAEGRLTVSNTLRPKPCEESTGIGLENLSNRCRIVAGRDIEIIRTSNLFTVKIPLLYE